MTNAHQRFLDLPPSELELLRKRAIELAKTPVAAEQHDRIELLEVRSRGQTFALPLNALDGVVELTSVAPVPRAPHIIRGLVSFRGELLLGLELASLVGNTSTGITDLRRIIALVSGATKVAILAEKVISIRSATLSSFHADTSRRFSFIVGIDEQFVSLLDPNLLVAHTLQVLGAS